MRYSLLSILAVLLLSTACTKKNATEAPTTDTPKSSVDAVEEPSAEADENQEQTAENTEKSDEPYEPQGTVERWNVADELVDCVGVAPQKCMRIRRAEKPEWENLYSNIQGFEYEEGTRYILEVDVIQVENPPADASSERYVLVRQIVPLAPGDEEKTCTSNADCEGDTFCAGPAGCDIPWTCQPPRPCTMDLRPFCSCEGETIRGSSSCPPAPYRHAGECT